MKTKKCPSCGRRYRIKSWHKEYNRNTCYCCNYIKNVLETTEIALNYILENNAKTKLKVKLFFEIKK